MAVCPVRLTPAVELRLRLANWPDDNAAAIVSDRGMYLGYVSAERALLICKRMKESQTVAVFSGNARKRSRHPDPLRRWRSYPTWSPMFRNARHPACLACGSTGVRFSRAYYPDEDRSGVWG